MKFILVLKEALFIKYKTKPSKYDEFWKQMKEVANTFCRDSKKRANKLDKPAKKTTEEEKSKESEL